MRGFVVALGVALVGGALMIVQGFVDRAHLFYAWHAAATFGLTLSIGGFIVGAVLANAGASWEATTRRVHDAIGGVLPVACLAYIPVLHISEHWILDVLYLVFAIGFEEALRAASLHDKKRAGIGAVGLVFVAVLMSLFFYDVTLEPSRPWISDMFALYVLVGSFGGALGATAFAGARGREKLRVTAGQASAYGRVELVATCLWAYCAFALYMLIWVADMPREVGFFVSRSVGAWGWLTVSLVFGRFVIPFLLLVPRAPKQRWWHVGAIGALMVAMHALDCEMLVVPSSAPRPSLLDFGPFFVVGGVFALVAMLRFRMHAPLPAARDVEHALAYEGS